MIEIKASKPGKIQAEIGDVIQLYENGGYYLIIQGHDNYLPEKEWSYIAVCLSGRPYLTKINLDTKTIFYKNVKIELE